MIYLDNAATTQITPAVVAAMLPYLTDRYGNAGSLYKLGRDSALAVEKARAQVAGLMGAKPEQIILPLAEVSQTAWCFTDYETICQESGRKRWWFLPPNMIPF